MKITIEIELHKGDLLRVRQNSLERVLNNAATVGSWAQDNAKGNEDISERGSTLWQDADELKPLASRLWNAFREATWTVEE